jgi:hypothetical protein
VLIDNYIDDTVMTILSKREDGGGGADGEDVNVYITKCY